MRALREAADSADGLKDAWPAFLLDTIRQTPMPDFLLHGEPYPALNAVVLSQPEHRQLVGLTRVFARIFLKATDRLAGDPVELERMGFPWVAAELLAAELARESGRPLVLGRFDFFLEPGRGWQLLEYNADTPSGARETGVVEGLIQRSLRRHWRARAQVQDLQGTGALLRRSIRRAFAAALAQPPPSPQEGGGVLGIVTDAGYAEDLAQAVFLRRLLAGTQRRALGVPWREVVAGDVDNLHLRGNRLWLIDRPLDALYRYYPFETLLGQQAFADLFTAVTQGRLLLLNGLRGLLAQNKGLLAWIWQRRDDRHVFNARERDAIQNHLPAAEWIGTQAAQPLQARRELVLKQVFGREGEEVYLGDRLSDEEWAQCARWSSYIVQRRVHAQPLPAVVQTAQGPAASEYWPCVGSFTAAGGWAGYYTRLGAPITSARAKYVATLIEPGQVAPPASEPWFPPPAGER